MTAARIEPIPNTSVTLVPDASTASVIRSLMAASCWSAGAHR
jgi:hypothetical protein